MQYSVAGRSQLTRRTALRAGGAALAACTAPTFIPAHVLGLGDAPSANEQVALGHIGVGGRGSLLLEATRRNPGVRSLAVADCFAEHRERAAASIGGDAYDDFRRVLDRPDIDGVVIATPDHWHVPIALLAAQAGKDVYLEKPLGISLEQDLLCRTAFAEAQRVFQYGTQQREAAHQQFGRELVRSGKLGTLKAIEVKAPNGDSGGSPVEAPIPQDFDYDMWLGPAPLSPYAVDRCRPPGTYWIYDYSIGYLAGWGAHPLDLLVWCYDGDLTGPYVVEGTGKIPTDGLYSTVYDWDVTIRMADGVKVTFRPGSDSTKFIGSEARLELTRNSIRAFPTDLLPRAFPENDHFANTAAHLKNFADAIRTRAQASSPVEDAVRSDVMSHLCDIAIRTGERLTWDPARGAIVEGSDQAKAMARRPLRAPWTL
jgi:predicted dehydrogenase